MNKLGAIRWRYLPLNGAESPDDSVACPYPSGNGNGGAGVTRTAGRTVL